VLFRDGQPVFSKYEPSSRAPLVGATTRGKPASEPRSGGDRLVPLRDPFRAETSVSRPRGIPTSFAFVGLSTATGLPESPVDPSSSVALTRLSVFGAEPVALPPLLASSPRAPPLSL
jgi:hypothetical protein